MYLKQCVFGAAEILQVNAACRRLYARSLAVLCYHGVVQANHKFRHRLYCNTVSVAEFEAQLDYVAKWFKPISAGDLIAALTDRKPLPKNSVLLTFDDGYRNNVTHAAPILLKKGIPAVFHLATDYIGSRAILWTDEILLRVLDWPEPTLTTPAGVFRLPTIGAWPERFRVARRISQACKPMPVACRNELLALLRYKTAPFPSHYDSEVHDFMDWGEARKLVQQGFELGSHTRSHPILTGLSVQALAGELSESRTTIEREIGCPCRTLAYPNGSRDDYSPLVVRETEKAGYSLAFSVEDRRAGEAPSRFAVPRLAIPGHVPLPIFFSKISGLYALLGRGR
jgi:peptidoglycan/xylan/chitin deacetylase (PgdA/CDA1 family)